MDMPLLDEVSALESCGGSPQMQDSISVLPLRKRPSPDLLEQDTRPSKRVLQKSTVDNLVKETVQKPINLKGKGWPSKNLSQRTLMEDRENIVVPNDFQEETKIPEITKDPHIPISNNQDDNNQQRDSMTSGVPKEVYKPFNIFLIFNLVQFHQILLTSNITETFITDSQKKYANETVPPVSNIPSEQGTINNNESATESMCNTCHQDEVNNDLYMKLRNGANWVCGPCKITNNVDQKLTWTSIEEGLDCVTSCLVCWSCGYIVPLSCVRTNEMAVFENCCVVQCPAEYRIPIIDMPQSFGSLYEMQLLITKKTDNYNIGVIKQVLKLQDEVQLLITKGVFITHAEDSDQTLQNGQADKNENEKMYVLQQDEKENIDPHSSNPSETSNQ